jgi:hypothetical protein
MHTATMNRLYSVVRLLVMVIGGAALVLVMSLQFSGSIASERDRLDFVGSGHVVAFGNGPSGEHPGKMAYITHVSSGSQAVVDRDGRIIALHNGRGDGPDRLEAVLEDKANMARILGVIQREWDPRANRLVRWPEFSVSIYWAPLFQFDGIKYVQNWNTDEGTLTSEDLKEFYRVAFKVDGQAGPGYRIQNGDATLLLPGTPVYAVKGYDSAFRLATVEDGRVSLYEANTNPKARIGADLLDIRGKVTAINILSEDDAETILGTIEEERSIKWFVDAILASPVRRWHHHREGRRYFLGFQLADGTSVVRPFELETGKLSPGIMTEPAVVQTVRSAVVSSLSDTDRP